MSIDILYVSWNREAYTRFSFDQLVKNTDWSLVNRLVVWDDYSTDGSLDYLREAITAVPVQANLRVGGYRSCVAIMNRYVSQYDADIFAKIDNDIVVPPGWLNDMSKVMLDYPELELLGMQAGFTQKRGPNPDPAGTGHHYFRQANHIGGVGLMRRSAFTSRPPLRASGRYGFTQWQERHSLAAGWIRPDLHVSALDQIPFDPWKGLSRWYTELKWQRPRPWPVYPHDAYYWAWWPEEARRAA